MGLTYKSCKIKSLEDSFNIKQKENSYVVALAGNPNTGKSTVFNYLTGLKQHTGNWPGKTIATARGEFSYNNINYNLFIICTITRRNSCKRFYMFWGCRCGNCRM